MDLAESFIGACAMDRRPALSFIGSKPHENPTPIVPSKIRPFAFSPDAPDRPIEPDLNLVGSAFSTRGSAPPTRAHSPTPLTDSVP